MQFNLASFKKKFHNPVALTSLLLILVSSTIFVTIRSCSAERLQEPVLVEASLEPTTLETSYPQPAKVSPLRRVLLFLGLRNAEVKTEESNGSVDEEASHVEGTPVKLEND